MNRRAIQTEADQLDLEIFRVVCSIDRFANEYRKDDAREMALIIDGLRHRIRRHMHPKDRDRTAAG